MIVVRPEEIVKHHTVTGIVVAPSIILTEFRKILGAQLLKLYIHIIVFSLSNCRSSPAAVPGLSQEIFSALMVPLFFTFYSLPHFHNKMKRFVFRQFYSENPVKLGFFAIDNSNLMSII